MEYWSKVLSVRAQRSPNTKTGRFTFLQNWLTDMTLLLKNAMETNSSLNKSPSQQTCKPKLTTHYSLPLICLVCSRGSVYPSSGDGRGWVSPRTGLLSVLISISQEVILLRKSHFWGGGVGGGRVSSRLLQVAVPGYSSQHDFRWGADFKGTIILWMALQILNLIVNFLPYCYSLK